MSALSTEDNARQSAEREFFRDWGDLNYQNTIDPLPLCSSCCGIVGRLACGDTVGVRAGRRAMVTYEKEYT
jgi:hypothetical protein